MLQPQLYHPTAAIIQVDDIHGGVADQSKDGKGNPTEGHHHGVEVHCKLLDGTPLLFMTIRSGRKHHEP